jgi:hypothetical protein
LPQKNRPYGRVKRNENCAELNAVNWLLNERDAPANFVEDFLKDITRIIRALLCWQCKREVLMLKSKTHFEQVPLALVEKLVKPVAENIAVARKKAKRKVSGTIAAQPIPLRVGAKP